MGTRARLVAALGIMIVVLAACSSTPKTPLVRSQSPTPSASKTPKPTLAGDYTVTATPCVNFRKNPEPGVNIISCVPNGATVKADGQSRTNGGYTWYHVAYKNQSGWIANQYLLRVGASRSASAT